jgi:sulfite reductase alpha subunit-like flavoprotein
VQHKLQEHSEEVEVLLSKGGYFYVCGDAVHMARDVHMQLVKIVAEKRNISALEAAQVITSMRSSNQYQVREMNESTALSIKIQKLT